jgi:hypothetical protein
MAGKVYEVMEKNVISGGDSREGILPFQEPRGGTRTDTGLTQRHQI